MKILLLPYDYRWPIFFSEMQALLAEVFREHESIIEHIGSTAVKGLLAKPVIDIMVGLPDLSAFQQCVDPLQDLGFVYFPQYEERLPNRRFFQLKLEEKGVDFNLHIVEAGSEWWKRHLLFREYLQENEAAREAYIELKARLAEKEWPSTNDYADAKSDFIRKMESDARAFFSQKANPKINSQG